MWRQVGLFSEAARAALSRLASSSDVDGGELAQFVQVANAARCRADIDLVSNRCETEVQPMRSRYRVDVKRYSGYGANMELIWSGYGANTEV